MSWKTVTIALMWSGCSNSGLAPRELGEGAVVTEVFDDAEVTAGVPSSLLLAIGEVETGHQMVQGAEEFPGQQPAFGVMALRGDNLERGAELAGLTVDEVKFDRDANVLAAAALLSDWAVEEGIDTSDLAAWAPVIARYSGIVDNDEAINEYVHLEVYETLNAGVVIEGLSMAPQATPIVPDWPLPAIQGLRTGDGSAIWTPSPNYNSRGGADPDFVIIHTCEGSYSGCWSWLANGASGVSAHYVVNDSGSEVRHLVDEDDRAWHISANYDCDNNSQVECWRDGTSMNTLSVGIEHAGFASQSTWDAGLISRSAELTCGITDRHGIPRDAYHIVGHGQLQPWNRTDPGAQWPWTDYLNQVDGACGAPPPPDPPPGDDGGSGLAPFVIDSNNGANDVSKYYIETSASWNASANVAGYYNTGYWYAATSPISDAAEFVFHLDAPGCWDVDAWWPAASDRPPAITFIGWDPDDREVGRATVNQQIDGARWNHLGDWDFEAGWNRVLLSRWTTPGYFAVADAVLLTPCN